MSENNAEDRGGELLTLAREREFDALEAAWMARLDATPPDLEELFRVAGYMVRKHFEEQAGLLLWSLVASVSEHEDAATALATAKRAALTAQSDKGLREEVMACYRRAHPEALRLEAVLEESNLLEAEDLESEMARLEALLHLRPGAYVTHMRSRRVGRVKGFERRVYVIEAKDSEYRHGPPDILSYWEPQGEDFRALAAFDPERVRTRAQSDPEGLIRMLLEGARGRIEFKELKAALIPDVLPQADWSKWWTAVKVTLKRSPWIELAGGTQPVLLLRSEAVGYREKFLERLERTKDPLDKVALVLEYVAEVRGGNESDPDLARDLGGALLKGAPHAETAVALAMLSAAEVLRSVAAEAPDASEELARRTAEVKDAGEILQGIKKDDMARMVLGSFKHTCPERWTELYAEAFPTASLRLCDVIARELRAAGAEGLFVTAAEKTAAMPDSYPLAFGWVWRHVLSEGGAVAERLSPLSASVILLRLMHRIERMPRHAENRAEARQALTKLRALVEADSSKRLKGLIARSDAAAAMRLHRAISGCEALKHETREGLLDELRDRHPEQFTEEQNLWEDGYLYLTAGGYAKCQAALAKLVNEDMRKNAVAIGAAAAKGDLRENWEYKSALEERDRLVERATRVRDEFDRARVISPADISGDEVNVGTTIELRDMASGEELTVTFLGPWDADIENGVYSYFAPLSLRFMGRKAGDRVRATFGDRTEAEYEIRTIERAV